MLLNIIKNRRAVYPQQYSDEPVSRDELEQILEAANWAPTHRRTEPWRFKVFEGEAKERFGRFLMETYERTSDKVSEFKKKQILEKASRSACVMAICFQRDPSESLPEWEEIASTAMAVQNMWLMAGSMGIGAYWSTPAQIAHLGEFIDLPEGERCIGFFYIGKYEGSLPEGTRKSAIDEKTTWY